MDFLLLCSICFHATPTFYNVYFVYLSLSLSLCVFVLLLGFLSTCYAFIFSASASASSSFSSQVNLVAHFGVYTTHSHTNTRARQRLFVVYVVLYTTLVVVIENIKFFTYNSIIYVVRFLFVAPSFIRWWICVVNLSILVSWRFFPLLLLLRLVYLGDFITLQSCFSFFFISSAFFYTHSHCCCLLYCCIDEGFFPHYVIMR